MEKAPGNVVLAFQDKTGEYARHVGVVLVSILVNTKADLTIHIFHDETLTIANQEKLAAICTKYGKKLVLHAVQVPENWRQINCLSLGTLYRLYIADILAQEHRALYFDSDVVVHLDIEPLLQLDMQGCALAAVHDAGTKINPFLYTRSVPLQLSKYFNAGVILFDLEKVRKQYNLTTACIQFLQEHPSDPFADQTALNYLLQDDCLLIDAAYNSLPTLASTVQEEKIWHFSGAYKPWQVRKYPVDTLYWQYLQETPWGREPEQLFIYYAQTVTPLDEALLTHPLGSRRKFLKNILWRLLKEAVKAKTVFFS